MAKVIYSSVPKVSNWDLLFPPRIISNLFKHRELIKSLSIREFSSAHRASYLGVAWSFVIPLVMLAIFYLVFGRILGGRFAQNVTETPEDYALALFIGLGFFNLVAQIIGSAPSLIMSNSVFVKAFIFPLEILPVVAVINPLINFIIGLIFCAVAFVVVHGFLHLSAICVIFYLVCIFLIALGAAWGLSAISVFARDIAAITSPTILILMFLCPIFYPASLVPQRIKWLVNWNPLAVIIEDARASFLYGQWPSNVSMISIFMVSSLLAILGYFFFMRAKVAFADVV